MRTFCVQTLGCKVNQYEAEQIASFLYARGLQRVELPQQADLCIIHTCSVTMAAAARSRYLTRRATRAGGPPMAETTKPTRVIVTGCWATSDKPQAGAIEGVDAVLGHQDDFAKELDRLLVAWARRPSSISSAADGTAAIVTAPERCEKACVTKAGAPASFLDKHSKSHVVAQVKRKMAGQCGAGSGERGSVGVSQCESGRPPNDALSTIDSPATPSTAPPITALPLLTTHRVGHTRALLKVQDGCDAHCTYCIIPKVRTVLWSKPVDDAVAEARRLVDAGHLEIVLTGIFLGAYGQPTALRRRQSPPEQSLATLVAALCQRVPGLRRLRLSSIEPGDLTDDLLTVLRSHQQIVPHFHVPLQSGSDAILRRMNRQYTRGDYLAMVERLGRAFDRPALTTDIIVGFPGETDTDFAQTVQVALTAGYVHIHAFPFSPRPGTAAARWKDQYVAHQAASGRMERLTQLSQQLSHAYRGQFVGQEVELLVELPEKAAGGIEPQSPMQNGRCPRYFEVHFECGASLTGKLVRVAIDRVSATRTFGRLIDVISTGSPVGAGCRE